MRRALTTPETAADVGDAIPMLGMANSLNVATAAAILLYWLTVQFEETD
jgi:tRNA G18 (ribose-2'-O)-methylase SpoU